MQQNQKSLYQQLKRTILVLVYRFIYFYYLLTSLDEDREIILSYPDCIKYVSSLLEQSIIATELAPASFKLIAELAKNETIRLQLSIHSIIAPICAYLKSVENVAGDLNDGKQQAFRALGNLAFDNGANLSILAIYFLTLSRQC